MMKKMNKMFPFVAFLAGLMMVTSCKDDNSDQTALDEEQRYFDIYLGANYPDAIPQPSGLYYVENKEGTGDMPGDTAWVLINHVAYVIPDDDVFQTYIESVAIDNRIQDTSALYGPYKTRVGAITPGFDEGLTLMREGGEATFLFTSELGYGSRNTQGLPAFSSLKYEVQLLEVLGNDIVSYEADKILAYTDTIAGADTVYYPAYDAAVYYVIDSVTDGPPVAVDSTIAIAYRGYLIDGRVFDESVGENYFEFTVGDLDSDSSPILGWQLGLQKFKQGEKGRLIIPYPLAYGEFGRYTVNNNVSIPPYETLVFDVEVITVDVDDENYKPEAEQ